MELPGSHRSNDLFHPIFNHVGSRPELAVSQNLIDRGKDFIVAKKLRVELFKGARHAEKLYSSTPPKHNATQKQPLRPMAILPKGV